MAGSLVKKVEGEWARQISRKCGSEVGTTLTCPVCINRLVSFGLISSPIIKLRLGDMKYYGFCDVEQGINTTDRSAHRQRIKFTIEVSVSLLSTSPVVHERLLLPTMPLHMHVHETGNT